MGAAVSRRRRPATTSDDHCGAPARSRRFTTFALEDRRRDLKGEAARET